MRRRAPSISAQKARTLPPPTTPLAPRAAASSIGVPPLSATALIPESATAPIPREGTLMTRLKAMLSVGFRMRRR